jgi:hypothetical protein
VDELRKNYRVGQRHARRLGIVLLDVRFVMKYTKAVTTIRGCSLQIKPYSGVPYAPYLRTEPHQDTPNVPLVSKAPGHVSSAKPDQPQQQPPTLRQLLAILTTKLPRMLETVKGLGSVCNGF